jgi:bifunctional N-acetylglucosamine-1-phosphate-uridyltransferase/glucosamine-1-phosphate-acetyltransferase GlmU-like protein
VVLAAGKGTRMGGDLPKVLHEAGGQPMLFSVLDAARHSGCDRSVAIVGHQAELVKDAVRDAGFDDVTFALQEPQNGTGHALAQAREAVAERTGGAPGLLLVLSGDVPLVTSDTLDALVRSAEAPGVWGSMAVADLDDPGSLGRVIPRADSGRSGKPPSLERIVEAADASPDELAVTLINAGLYVLPTPEIWPYLDRLDAGNAQGELYLTDALGDAVRDGERVALHTLADPAEATGVNTREELAEAHRLLVERRPT